MQLPKMATVKQHFAATSLDDVAGEVRSQLAAAGLADAIAPGARIAVSSGSRGIANIPLITRTVVDCVKAAGGEPFLLPAMGSHGGATAEGQIAVLASYGITEESMGCPVESTMDVVEVDQLADGTPVLLNRLATEADGVLLINRIKPHTSFRGVFESGLMKMMTIGLHTRIIGRPARIAGLDRVLAHIAEKGGAWIARRDEIARHWHKLHGGNG